MSSRPSTGRHAAGRLPLAQPLPGSSHRRHALPPAAGTGTVRATLRRAALLSGALSVLAVPIVATVVTQSPPDAAAAARADAGMPAIDLRALQASYASTDIAVGEQIATATMQTAAEQAAAVQAAAVQAAAVQAAAVQAAAVQAQAAATQAEADRLAQEQAAAARASRSRSVAPAPAPAVALSGDPRAIAQAMLNARGQGSQFSCLDQLWNRESGWSITASNASSGAYGIPQSLPGSKMASAGSDWQTNAATQITWGLSYIAGRYGSPCAAWGHSQSVGWY